MKTKFYPLIILLILSFASCEKDIDNYEIPKAQDPFYPERELEMIGSLLLEPSVDTFNFNAEKIDYHGKRPLTFIGLESKLYAIDLEGLSVVWTSEPLNTHFSNFSNFSNVEIFDYKDQLIIGSNRRFLIIDASNGSVISVVQSDLLLKSMDFINAGFSVVDDVIFLLGGKGPFNAATMSLFTYDLDQQVLNPIFTFVDAFWSINYTFLMRSNEAGSHLVFPISAGASREQGIYVFVVGAKSGKISQHFIPSVGRKIVNTQRPYFYKDSTFFYFETNSFHTISLKFNAEVLAIKHYFGHVDGEYLFGWSNESRLFELYSRNTLSRSWRQNNNSISSITINPCVHPTQSIAALIMGRDLALMDLSDGSLLTRQKLEQGYTYIKSIFFSKEGDLLYVLNNNGHLKAFKWIF